MPDPTRCRSTPTPRQPRWVCRVQRRSAPAGDGLTHHLSLASFEDIYVARVRDHRIELLHAGGHLAALIELVPEADHLLIENVAVLPAFQGQGHGRQLLAHAEAVAASLGLSTMRLYTNPHFAGNVQLYGRLGYRVDREEPFKGSVTVYMSKQLHPSSKTAP